MLLPRDRQSARRREAPEVEVRRAGALPGHHARADRRLRGAGRPEHLALPGFQHTLEDLAADPQAWANDYFVTAYCEEVKREVKVRGLPITLSKTPGEVRSLGPELGQDTEMILFETLGYDWDRIGELKSAGVIP